MTLGQILACYVWADAVGVRIKRVRLTMYQWASAHREVVRCDYESRSRLGAKWFVIGDLRIEIEIV